jgi:hypothetical protein
MKISVIYKRLIQLGKVAGAISFLVAAPYALVQYIQSRDAARVEQTISLFKMYNSPPFSGYREKLTRSLAKNKEQIDQASSKSAADFKALQFQMLKQDDIEPEILLLLDFFDGVAVCVTSKLCDNDAAIKLFKPRALDLYINYFQYISEQRGALAKRSFGLGLEAIAKSQLPN